ncbi:hypothetical protein IWQ57_006500, partial [Coemansia nantahalensis]
MGTAQHRRCRHHSGRAGSSRVIDDLDSLFGPQHSREERRGARQHGSAGTGTGGLAGHIQRHSVDARNLRDEGTPLARWMASLSSDAITDPQADGLLGASSDRRKPLVARRAGHLAAPASTARLSFFLVIDMDPETTADLNDLRADGHRSRNGSLGPTPENAQPAQSPDDGGGVPEAPAWTRTCEACSRLSFHPGRVRLCGIHKALRLGKVDMRDWESRGEVWASEPTILMDAPTVHPDEYDKEDPQVLKWIKQTLRRLIRTVAVEYHRDLNWYRMHYHVRMANLPPSLAPQDIGALVGFVERQGWIDVGSVDSRVQQLLDVDISAYDVIRSLQHRMRRLYMESTLLMAMLQAEDELAAPVPAAAG